MLRWLAICLLATLNVCAQPSRCFGTVSNGRIENSVRLPLLGVNFVAYSGVGVAAGRTYVHQQVAEIVLEAYAAVAKTKPSAQFVYGETGFAQGGRFAPHRTHQNGLSVDFFVPVLDQDSKPTTLPMGLFNRFGYDLEFDADGRYLDYQIDFESMAEHLYQLHRAASARKLGIALLIVEPAYQKKLLASARGRYLRRHLRFLQGRPWVRHDEHYHVDFQVACGRK
jgi:penicillin-insensitive murein endopeptidase